MTTDAQPIFRFDRVEHRYYIDDVEVPHITGMLTDTGWSNDDWYTAESAERGRVVHDFAARYDLWAMRDPHAEAKESTYAGWCLAYIEAVRLIRPTWLRVETCLISPVHRFGGRPDRVGKLWGAWAVVELKTGSRSRATPIQTALQAILVAPELRLPPEAIVRYELDLKATGKAVLLEHPRRFDFMEAYDVIGKCCGAKTWAETRPERQEKMDNDSRRRTRVHGR